MKFIHAADIHLDSPLVGLEHYDGAPVDELRNASRRALENLVALAVEEQVDCVLLAGDLYDGDWRDYNTGLFFVRQMADLRGAGIRVFVISGNHDAASRITKVLPLPDNVHVFGVKEPETVLLDDLRLAVHGQGYGTREVIADLAAGYPLSVPGYCNIGLLHTSLTGREGHDSYAPCSVDGLLAKGYDYWALGHVHKREVVHESPWIVFPGNIQGRHIRETGPKGCTLVTVEDTDIVDVAQRDLDVARWATCVVDAAGLENVDAVISLILSRIEETLAHCGDRTLAVRIPIGGKCRAHRGLTVNPDAVVEEIRAIVLGRFGGRVWIEKVQLHTGSALDLDNLLAGNDPLGGLLRVIQDMETVGEVLAAERRDIEALLRKLPAEIHHGDGLPDLDDPAQVVELFEGVRQLLIPLLLDVGEEP